MRWGEDVGKTVLNTDVSIGSVWEAGMGVRGGGGKTDETTYLAEF